LYFIVRLDQTNPIDNVRNLFGLDPATVKHVRACASLFGMWDDELLGKADALKEELLTGLY